MTPDTLISVTVGPTIFKGVILGHKDNLLFAHVLAKSLRFPESWLGVFQVLSFEMLLVAQLP